jgi:hypothetical protein
MNLSKSYDYPTQRSPKPGGGGGGGGGGDDDKNGNDKKTSF